MDHRTNVVGNKQHHLLICREKIKFSLCVSSNHFFEKKSNHGNCLLIQNHSPRTDTLHLLLLVISLHKILFDNNMVVLHISGVHL